MDVGRLIGLDDAFNRTILECKSKDKRYGTIHKFTFNRTILECKSD